MSIIDLNDFLPVAPPGRVNSRWQWVISENGRNRKVSTNVQIFGSATVKSTDYVLRDQDGGTIVVYDGSADATFTYPNPPPNIEWCTHIQNVGAGVLTLDFNGMTLDAGLASIRLTMGQGIYVAAKTDLSAYYSERGMGIQLGGDIGGTAQNPIVVGIQSAHVATAVPVSEQILVFEEGAWRPSYINISAGPMFATSASFASGTLELGLQFVNQPSGTVLAGPISGSGAPTFISIVDILNTFGPSATATWGGGASGTVSGGTVSGGIVYGVGLLGPPEVQTTAFYDTGLNLLELEFAFKPVAANQFFRGPVTGTAVPTFGPLDPVDLPTATSATFGGIMLAGDLGGTPELPRVVGFRGQPLTTATPTNGDVYSYSTASMQFELLNLFGDGTGPGQWVKVVPSGLLNSTNKIFVLPHLPVLGTLFVFVNIIQSEGTDYTVSGNQITFSVAPKARDAGWFFARYQRQ